MLRCEHCRLDLPGEQTRYPLCQNKPVGTPGGSGNRFPRLPSPRWTANRVLIVWLAFGSACAVAIRVMINLIMPTGGWWSLLMIAGIVSLWTDVSLIVKRWKNLPKNILWQVIIVTLIAFLWDSLTGFSSWSLNFVFPIPCFRILPVMTIVVKACRLDTKDHTLYLVIGRVLGIVYFIPVLTDAVRVVILLTVSFEASIVFLVPLLFLEGRAFWTEIQRRSHL